MRTGLSPDQETIGLIVCRREIETRKACLISRGIRMAMGTLSTDERISMASDMGIPRSEIMRQEAATAASDIMAAIRAASSKRSE